MTNGPLPVTDIIEVSVSAAPSAVAPLQFNQGLVVGSSAVIPSYGSNPRIRQYPSLAAMLTDGFTDMEPEYLAAERYFEQSPSPNYVWVGRQDLTAILTAIPHSGNAGTGYAVGDQITVVQSGGSHGVLTVLTVTSGGVVATLGTTIGNQGTGYADATGLSTTGGSGTNLEVDITAIGETLLQAVEACALVNSGGWYPFMCTGAVDADHLALAAWSTANWESALYLGSSADAAIPAGTSGNLALEMQAANYRALLSYNTTQTGDEYPNNVYAAAAIMGQACGLNTGAPGSAFTLNLKQLAGIAAEPLSQAQFETLLGTAGNNGENCNTCASFGAFIGYFVNGILSSGEWFDQILFRAMLVNLIQTNLMDLLISVPKIPQTDPGEHQLIAVVEAACAQMALIGYLGPGDWEGDPIGNFVATGQSLPEGYIVGAPSYATQSAGARAARQAMPIYAAIIEAGAVHSVQVNVSVQM